jgi:hypothetical protein
MAVLVPASTLILILLLLLTPVLVVVVRVLTEQEELLALDVAEYAFCLRLPASW